MERCPDYVGVACVDGSCPMIDRDDQWGYVRPILKSCEECYLYRGCVDCIFELYDCERKREHV